jgi:broad specificity phosphatase PhoE
MDFEKIPQKLQKDTRIILIRHGITDANCGLEFEGEPHLTRKGHEQSRKLADRLKRSGVMIDRIYASTLIRAKQTAQYTGLKFFLPVILSDALVEIGTGKSNWKPKNTREAEKVEISEGYVLWENQMKDLPEEKRWVSLEHLERLKKDLKEIVKEIEKISKENEGKTIAIFSHGGVIRLLRCFYNNPLEGLTQQNLKKTPWSENTSITIFDRNHLDNKYKVMLEDDYTHLKDRERGMKFP